MTEPTLVELLRSAFSESALLNSLLSDLWLNWQYFIGRHPRDDGCAVLMLPQNTCSSRNVRLPPRLLLLRTLIETTTHSMKDKEKCRTHEKYCLPSRKGIHASQAGSTKRRFTWWLSGALSRLWTTVPAP